MDEGSQQAFLRHAMKTLGMTYDEFASRLHISRKTLENWLAGNGSGSFRKMPDMARAFIEEILRNTHR
ncbi:transcriptional regulator [Paraburkholderia sacchari]|uniref:transcriptional regulator n=1 Tax=Paraburkholderia sacchari TaxID=159450 RepID=UPI000542237C|nr:transcriptional regulator [Paraburkholderia sacchari]NLP65526.1 transcriptional regulator [Paraburkholderia sacchari]